MDRTEFSGPNGDRDVQTPAVEDRTPDQRPMGRLPGWPVWTQVPQVSPWEAVEIPEGPATRAGAADQGPETDESADDLVEKFLAWGRDRGFAKGGVHSMRRLLTALTTLATLFVVAGAGWKW